jgi:hypothetical protein
VVREKYEPIWPVQVQRDLPVSIAFQLVTSARQVAHCIKIRSRTKIVKASPHKLCALHIVLPNETFEIIAVISEVCVLELDVHISPSIRILTQRVNGSQGSFSTRDRVDSLGKKQAAEFQINSALQEERAAGPRLPFNYPRAPI